MYSFPIGVIIDSFRTDTRTAVQKAAALGVNGIQMYTSTGKESDPRNMTPAKRRELLDFVKSNGLEFSALVADPGYCMYDKEINVQVVEDMKRMLDLAKDLGTNILTGHIGVVPADPKHERYAIMREAFYEVVSYAESIGSYFAIETGPERAVTLKSFLVDLNCKGAAINLDPANFMMVTGDDPAQAVYTLKDYIVHTHAKDGKMLVKADPEVIYGLKPMPEELMDKKFYSEVPLGEGSVDFPKYLAALEDIGYRGYLTIEREVGADPAADILLAKNFLLDMIKTN